MIPFDLIIHPSETLKELMKDRSITKKELAIKCGVTRDYVNSVLCGQRISNTFAKKLEKALNIPSSFWINLQRNYDNELLEYQRACQENNVPDFKIPKYAGRETKQSLLRKMNALEKEKKNNERIYRINRTRYCPSGIYLKERDGKQWYTHYYRGKRSKYLKRLSNRKIRKYKGEISGKGWYKKLFDYWWELY